MRLKRIKMNKKGVDLRLLLSLIVMILVLVAVGFLVKNQIIGKDSVISELASCGNAGQTGNCTTEAACNEMDGQVFKNLGCESDPDDPGAEQLVCCITILS